MGHAGSHEIALGRGIELDPPSTRIHDEHLAGTEPGQRLDLGGGQGNGARLRRCRHQAIVGDGIGDRPEPVAIQDGAQRPSIGEDQRGRTVPWGEEARGPTGEAHRARGSVSTQRGRLRHQGREGRRDPPA